LLSFFLGGVGLDYMQYRTLGKTGLVVSRLCFGGLTIGPLQVGLPLKEGARVIRRALEQGVNFIGTAEMYETYPYIKEAVRGFSGDVIIATKCYAYTYQGMKESIKKALAALGREMVDIFMLHEQESELTIKGHWEAVKCLLDAKKAGVVRAVGISTHHVAAVRAAVKFPEIEVIHPIINMQGIGICDGTKTEMLAAIKEAFRAGKGIYGMKSLGGGNLLSRVKEAFDFVLNIEELSSIAVGMQSVHEVDFNVRFFSGDKISTALERQVASRPRTLHIEDWCRGCGNCVERCSVGALQIIEGKAVVNKELCRLCGYCSTVCPEFCIKII